MHFGIGFLDHSEDTDKLILGVNNYSGDEAHTLLNLYFKPILEITRIFKKKFYKLKNYFQKKFILKEI